MSQTLEIRVAKLEEQMSLQDEEIKKLKTELIGTADKPGVFESIRSMKASVDSLKECLENLTSAVDRLASDRHKFAGVVIGVGGTGALIGWLLKNVIEKISP